MSANTTITLLWDTGIPGLWTQVLDARPWTLDSGRWTLNAELATLDPGRWTLDPGPWTLDSGPLDYERWTLDANANYVKNQKTPQSMCWNVKKLESSPFCKENSNGEWEEITEIYRKNKKKRGKR